MRPVGELDAVPRVASSTGCRGPAASASGTRRSRRRRGRRTGRSSRARRATLSPAADARTRRRRSSASTRRAGSATASSRRRCRSTGCAASRPSTRQLAAADLVQDLARLLVPEVVDPVPCSAPSRCSAPRASPGRPRASAARDQRVPPEEGQEPGQPGRRQDVAARPAGRRRSAAPRGRRPTGGRRC